MQTVTLFKQHRAAGFTLLEVIIVAFILALIAGTVVVNITPAQRDSDARTAAVVFKEKMSHARQIALIRNWVIGVHVEEDSYGFYRWQNGQWRRLDEGALSGIEFIDLELELIPGDFAILDNIIDGDRNAIFRSERERRDDDEEPVEPRLMIFESSDFVPFTLAIRDRFGGVSYWVDGRDGLHITIKDQEP